MKTSKIKALIMAVAILFLVLSLSGKIFATDENNVIRNSIPITSNNLNTTNTSSLNNTTTLTNNTTLNNNTANIVNNTSTINANTNKNVNTNTSSIPKAGIEDTPLIIFIGCLIVLSIFAYAKIKKYRSL